MDSVAQFNNVDGFLQGPVPGLITKHFGTFDFDPEKNLMTVSPSSGQPFTRHVPDAEAFIGQLPQSLVDYKWLGAEGARHTWRPGYDSTSLILTSLPTTASLDDNLRWHRVQAVGFCAREQFPSYREGFDKLSDMAVRVFIEQFSRKFLYGLYIRGSMMEVWVFDRAGAYCSNLLDVTKDFHQVLAILYSIQAMTTSELGEYEILRYAEGVSYVELKGLPNSAPYKLYLDHEPVRRSKALIGSGIHCYFAKTSLDSVEWEFIVKIKWRRKDDRPEDELLRLAERRCEWRPLLHLNHYSELATSQNYLPGYDWKRPAQFIDSKVPNEDGKEKGMLAHTEQCKWALHREYTLLCSVTSPVGRPVTSYKSLTELHQVFHDYISCHRSLYFDALIIHRDVSSGNMIILDDTSKDTSSVETQRGLLIDLDQSVLRSEKIEAGRYLVGTKIFMSIETLNRGVPTYRTDLESFLYTYMWLLLADKSGNLPESSKLKRWVNNSYPEAASCKLHDMEKANLEAILRAEVPKEYESVNNLIMQWREILFPIRDGKLWTGTDSSDEAAKSMYSRILELFENQDAIRSSM